MVTMQRVLVVGATGYLGKFIVKELKSQGYWVRALSRANQKIEPVKQYVDEVILGEATKPETIDGLCKNIDIVVSSLGITKQKDRDYIATKGLETKVECQRNPSLEESNLF